MKKQYHTTETHAFKCRVCIYHDGTQISSKEMWLDDADEYISELEKRGYICGYTTDEVNKAKRLYEHKLSNLIERR